MRNFINSGLVVKDLFKENYPQATIEYWLRPNSMVDYNQQVGPGWGKVLIRCGVQRWQLHRLYQRRQHW